MNGLAGVTRSQANWAEAWVEVWYEPGAEPLENDLYGAIKRANLTPGERIQ